MTNSLKIENSLLVIGRYSMIHDIRITKENFRLDGLVPMKSLKFLIMD